MNEKINIGELTNQIKKNSSDNIKNDTLLNYVLLEKTISLSDKIKAYGNKNLFNKNLKDKFSLIYYSFKCLNLYIKNSNNKELLDSNIFVICKALCRISSFFNLEYPLFSFFYLNKCKKILSNLPKSDLRPEFISIINTYNNDLEKEIFNEEKENFEDNELLIEKIKSIFYEDNKNGIKENENNKNMINIDEEKEEEKEKKEDEKMEDENEKEINNNNINIEQNNEIENGNNNVNIEQLNENKIEIENIENKIEIEKENKEFIYIIDKIWYENCKLFINELYKGKDINIFFNEEDIKINWVKGKKIYYSNIYCGPINNMSIIDTKDIWYDPIDKYTNVYLKNNLDESQYEILSELKYNILKDNFGIYDIFEIKREKDEINLIQMKILILSIFFFDINKENHMRRKSIQISKKTTLQQFTNKIISIMDYFLNNNINKINNNETNNKKIDLSNINLSIYFTNKKLQKFDILTIIYSYKTNPTNYEVKIPELKLTELKTEEQFKKFLENYNKKETEILIEINTKSNENTFFQNTIKNQNLTYEICNLCNITQNEQEEQFKSCERLQSCTIKYCSKKCKEQDKFHIIFHKSFNSIISQKFNIKLLLEISVDDFLNPNSKHGLTGLMNLGNTCFMNSAIQCLSNCELLTTYFISGMYKSEINKNKKYGTGGLIVNCYYDLLEKLWVQDKRFIHPINFKDLFGFFVKQFSGFSQEDSHEMLTFMLDNIHEDLNRNKEKKYVELKEKQDFENDEMASQRWWNCNLERDNSIIVDLFYGQFKSTVQCPICDKININYDQFMCLGLPIPNYDNGINGFCYVVNNKNNSVRKINLFIGEDDLANDIFNRINKNKKYCGIFCNGEKMYLCLLNDKIPIFKVYKNYVNTYKNFDCKIIIYEYDNEEIENKFPIFFIPITKENDNEKINILFYPRPFYFNLNDTVQNIYDTIKEHYYKYYKEENSNFSEEKIILKIINNLTPCTKDHLPCDYCNKRDCNNCDFNFNKNDTIETLINSQSKKRTFLIYIEIPNLENEDLSLIKLFNDYNNDEGTFDSKINLYSCFKALSKKEKLDEENLWYCSKCKEHRNAIKQLQIYKLPIILILQIKRFKNHGFFFNNKNDTNIDFPIHDLDLNDFIVGKNDDKKYIYELFAVNQHFGISIGGHYTALCKNGNKWYDFDDEDVTEINENRLVSSNAYLLFYKLKN